MLKGGYKNEEISISVMRLAEPDVEDDEDSVNQLFLDVCVSKPGWKDSMRFLCALYPDAIGIHSISLVPKEESPRFVKVPTEYGGPVFE